MKYNGGVLMKKYSKVILPIIIISLMVFLIGCSGKKAGNENVQIEKVNVNEIREFADAAAEKIFKGISEENFGMFSEDFDDQMKKALTEKEFKQIVNQLGKYESKELIDADRVQGYTRAYYKTKFSKISKDVLFTVVFNEADEIKVSGLFYK